LEPAPRLLGVTAGGTQTLTFPRLTGAFHDLTAGTELAGADDGAVPPRPGPNNTVTRYRRAVRSSIGTSPDRALAYRDVAHICWQWLDLQPGVTDVAARHG
jgi:hypothetical protein